MQNPIAAAARLRGASLRRFARHYLEMLVAMAIGMAALGPLWHPILALLGQAELIMLPVMAAVMLVRPDEYTRDTEARESVSDVGAGPA